MNNTLVEGFWKRTLHFTEKLLVWLTVFFFISWVASFVVILDAIHTTGNFSFLDTLIAKTCDVFEGIVGISIIKFAVENVFKYNDFGGRVISREPMPEGAFFEEDTYAETEAEG